MLNTLIYKLPVKLHIPGYQYYGPGTNLEQYLCKNACKEHYIAYANTKNFTERHVAYKILEVTASRIIKTSEAGVGEKWPR